MFTVFKAAVWIVDFGGSMVRKWRIGGAEMAVCGAEMAVLWCGCGVLAVWFLYDCVANGAF